MTDTLVRAGTRVRGDIRGVRELVVDGRLDGAVDVDGELVIGPSGVVRGEVRAHRVRVLGILVGSIRARDAIAVHGTARVVGDLRAPAIDVHDDAVVDGRRSPADDDAFASDSSRVLWQGLPGQARPIPREPPALVFPTVGRSTGRMRISS